MKRLFIVVFMFLLTGCAGLNSDFSCNETAQGSCITVSEANTQAASNIKGNKNIKLSDPNLVSLMDDKNESLRTKELVYKIYVNQYVDDKDYLHKEQTIYFTIMDPSWKGYN